MTASTADAARLTNRMINFMLGYGGSASECTVMIEAAPDSEREDEESARVLDGRFPRHWLLMQPDVLLTTVSNVTIHYMYLHVLTSYRY